MEKEKVICEVCGKELKDKAGLSGHMRFKHNQEKAKESQATEPTKDTKAVVKRGQSPLEQLVQELRLPTMVDGQAEIFDSGVEYGVRSVLVGVRVAQELSAMGVQQAVPIIKMAQEMRESEGQAAKIIAAELAEATLEGNKDLKGALHQLGSQMTASAPNPMMSMMVGALQPILGQTIERMMRGFSMGKQGQTTTEPPPYGGQEMNRKIASDVGSGIEDHSIDEWED
ncbi:MAG: hypothetical protein PHI12_04485 [Dehalococcoidales bacterium]|nr:hypothetical protein [Dehalococcoidales bacterium]